MRTPTVRDVENLRGEVEGLTEELAQARGRLAQLRESAPDSGDMAALAKRLTSLKGRRGKLEKEVDRLLEAYRKDFTYDGD